MLLQKLFSLSKKTPQTNSGLILTLLNFLNGHVHFPFLELLIIIYGDITIRIIKKNLETLQYPSQTVWMCRLAWLSTGGKGLPVIITSVPALNDSCISKIVWFFF